MVMKYQPYSSQLTQAWTSGSPVIDNLIKSTQFEAKYYHDKFLEWISYKRLKKFEKIGEGGFGCVYSATWMDGEIKHDYYNENDRSKPITVAVKQLKNSKNLPDEFFNEVIIYI